MSALAKLLGAKAAPARSVVTLPPSAFADTWSRRPNQPVKMGLRLISEEEFSIALRAATAAAHAEYPQPTEIELRIHAHNDHLQKNVLAQVCVQADDMSKPYFAPAPEMLIRAALTPGAIRRLWDEYATRSLADGQEAEQATDEQVQSLPKVALEAFLTIDLASQTRVRKLLAAALREVELAKTIAPEAG